MITSVWRWLAAALAVDVVLAWALADLFGAGALVAVVVGGLCGSAVQWWQQWRRPEDRERQRVVGSALREQRDPGPEWRDEVTSLARQRLARPSRERWLPAALCAVVALACLVAAVLRDEWTDALPAAPLLVVGAATVRVAGQRLLDAARWVDSPPYPVDVPVEG